MSSVKFLKVRRPEIAGTATIPETALDRYLRDGWTVVDETQADTEAQEAPEAAPLNTPSRPAPVNVEYPKG